VKTKTLARNYLNEELFQLLRLQRLRITVGFQAKMPIDTTLVTLDCNIVASNIVGDLKKTDSMSDTEMLQEGKTNLENPVVIENILVEFYHRIINRGRSTCKIL
jgi:hypothetical protein